MCEQYQIVCNLKMQLLGRIRKNNNKNIYSQNILYLTAHFVLQKPLLLIRKNWSQALQGQMCAFKMTLITHIINRPGVAGVVLQTPQSLIKSVTDAFPPNLQNIINL